MITLRKHLEELQAERDLFEAERDRRYAEVNVEKEKALKIKETADLAALQLAREIQTYKDEKANELREQINSERGHYASKDDLQNVSEKLEASIKPLADFVSSQQGRDTGSKDSKLNINYVLTAIVSITAIITLILALTHHI
jgi:hypothetical protein